MTESNSAQIRNFTIIGGIGFAIDGGLLTVLNSLFEVDLLLSRLCSFSVAVSVTWYLNRHRTFAERQDKNAALEWSRYAAVNSIGALLNMGIFFWLVHRFNELAKTPLLPLAAASFAALFFNFFASKHIAFGRRYS